MKKQKISKKLTLSKHTVAHLDAASMGKLKGGACTWPETGCTALRFCCTEGYGYNPNTCGTYYYCPPESDPGNTCPS